MLDKRGFVQQLICTKCNKCPTKINKSTNIIYPTVNCRSLCKSREHLITFDGGKTSSSPSPSLASMSSPQELKDNRPCWLAFSPAGGSTGGGGEVSQARGKILRWPWGLGSQPNPLHLFNGFNVSGHYNNGFHLRSRQTVNLSSLAVNRFCIASLT